MKHFAIHRLLTKVELEEITAFASEPGRTVDQCTAWMKDRGKKVCRAAVHNWMRSLRQQGRLPSLATGFMRVRNWNVTIIEGSPRLAVAVGIIESERPSRSLKKQHAILRSELQKRLNRGVTNE